MEATWYYVTNGTEKAGPVPESELRSLVEQGAVSPDDLVWKDGMADWAPFAQALGGAAPAASPLAAAAATPIAAAMASPIAQPGAVGGGYQSGYEPPPGLGGWLQFVGVMTIIFGALTCLAGVVMVITIIGPLIYIPLGIALILSGTACTGARAALLNMTAIDAATDLFLCKIKRYMLIYGILYILNLVLVVIAIVGVIIAIAVGAMNFDQMMSPGGMP